MKKHLTNEIQSDRITKLSARQPRKEPKQRIPKKKLEKSLRKVLTRGLRSDILTRLTLTRAEARSSLKIEQQRQTKNSENSFELKNTVVQE